MIGRASVKIFCFLFLIDKNQSLTETTMTDLASLAGIKAAFEANLIDAEQKKQLSDKLLGLAPTPVASTAVTQVTTEDPVSKAQKEVRAAIAQHIGTLEKPKMSAKFHAAVFLQCPEEKLRVELGQFLSGSLMKSHLSELFRATTVDTVPTGLDATGPIATLARLATREWLVNIYAPYSAWDMTRNSSNTSISRQAAQQAVIRAATDDDAQGTGSTLLANLAKMSNLQSSSTKTLVGTGEEDPQEVTRKREREQATRDRQRETQRMKDKQLSEQQRRFKLNAGGGGDRRHCHFCGQDGHLQRDCAEYSRSRSAAGGK